MRAWTANVRRRPDTRRPDGGAALMRGSEGGCAKTAGWTGVRLASTGRGVRDRLATGRADGPDPGRSGVAAPCGAARGGRRRTLRRSLAGSRPAHGVEHGDGVAAVAPVRDLSVLDRDDGDEVVVVGGRGADRLTADRVCEDDDRRFAVPWTASSSEPCRTIASPWPRECSAPMWLVSVKGTPCRGTLGADRSELRRPSTRCVAASRRSWSVPMDGKGKGKEKHSLLATFNI